MELLHKKLRGIKFNFTKELECAICLELLTEPVVTKCNHQFCRRCLTNAIEKKCIKRCQMCNEVLSKRSMIESATLKPLVSDWKRLVAAMDSDFELHQDIQVAFVLSDTPLPAATSTPKQLTASTPRMPRVQLQKINRSPKDDIENSPTLLTQISKERKSVVNTGKVNYAPVIYHKNSMEVSKSEDLGIPEAVTSGCQESIVESLEVQQAEHGNNSKNAAKSPNLETEVSCCQSDDGINPSDQSTIELVLENEPPIPAKSPISICATSKVENWLKNRCVSDVDSPKSSSSDNFQQKQTTAEKSTKNPIPKKVSKSRLVLDGNTSVIQNNGGSDDPYQFISSQKVYPKMKKRNTRRANLKSCTMSPVSKFVDLIKLRERKVNAAKEKSCQAVVEDVVSKHDLQSQPFPSSCLVNVHDKFDEVVLNGINNKQVKKSPVKRSGPVEPWNDDESNVFLTPAYAHRSPNREKENITKKLEKICKKKSLRRDRKLPKHLENNTLNILMGEIMDAEQHELCIESPNPKPTSKLSLRSNTSGTALNKSEISTCEYKHHETTANTDAVSKEKVSVFEKGTDIENESLLEVPSNDVMMEFELTPLLVENWDHNQSSVVIGRHRRKSDSEEIADTSAKNEKNTLPLVEEILGKASLRDKRTNQISPAQKGSAPADCYLGELGSQQQPVIMEDYRVVPRSDTLEPSNVQIRIEEQLPNTDEKSSKDIVRSTRKRLCKVKKHEINTDNPISPVQKCFTTSGKLGEDQNTVAFDNFTIIPKEHLNPQACAEKEQIRKVKEKSASFPVPNAKMQMQTPEANVDSQMTSPEKKSAPMCLNFQKLGNKQPLDFANNMQNREGIAKDKPEITTSKYVPVPHKPAEIFPRLFTNEPMCVDIPETCRCATVVCRKMPLQFFGPSNGEPLFSFVKLGKLCHSLADQHHSIECQTEPNDQDYRNSGITTESIRPELTKGPNNLINNNSASLKRCHSVECQTDPEEPISPTCQQCRSSVSKGPKNLINNNSALLKRCHSVECQTVPEEPVPTTCQHCRSSVSRVNSSSSATADAVKKTEVPLDPSGLAVLAAKIPESQDETEIVIPASQDMPCLEELSGLFNPENPEKVAEFQNNTNTYIVATGRFDVMPVIRLPETETEESLDILAPDTCTQDGNDKCDPKSVMSKLKDGIVTVQESEVDLCLPEVKTQEVPALTELEIEEINADNADSVNSSQTSMENDIVPPTPPPATASGTWKRSPGVNRPVAAQLVSQKRKHTPVKGTSAPNKKTRTEEVSQEVKSIEVIEITEGPESADKPLTFDKNSKESNWTDCGSFPFDNDDAQMAKVLANISLDLAKSTIIEDDDGIFGDDLEEITVLEAKNRQYIVQTIQECVATKAALDAEMSEEIFAGVTHEFAKPYPSSEGSAKVLANVSENCRVQADPPKPSLRIETKKQLSGKNKEIRAGQELLPNDVFKLLNWDDFATDEDFSEEIPRKYGKCTTSAAALHSEPSTVSTLQTTFATTQERENLKKDIENDKRQLKEIEILLAKKQHNGEAKIDKKPKEEEINQFQFDSDVELDECLLMDNESLLAPVQRTEVAGTKIAAHDHFSWDPNFGSWESQDKVVNKLASQKKQSQMSKKCMPKVNTSPTVRTPPKAPASKYSLVVSGSSASEQHNVQLLATQLKGSFHGKFNETTTHVIVKLVGNLCERTLKYILGISAGRWIVSYKWVIDSLAAGKAMPEANYEVVGDTNEGVHNGPQKSRTNLNKPLLTNYEICLVKPFTELTEDQLKSILHYSGATYIPDPEHFSESSSSIQLVICENQFHKSNEFDGLLIKHQVATVSRDWLLDSIASYAIKPTKPYTLR